MILNYDLILRTTPIDGRHKQKLFKRGEFVKLSTRNLKFKDKMLQQRWIGSLRVLKQIGVQAYQLALPGKYP
jgi:hypothetical protein